MKDVAIKENHLYRKTFQRGKRWSGRYVTVCVLKDLAARRLMKAHPKKQYINRIGLSVPKREGGAIERNRVKRIIRAGLQPIEREGKLRRGFLIVIASRAGIEKQKSPAIESELRYIFRKLDMFEAHTPAPKSPSHGKPDGNPQGIAPRAKEAP